MVLQNVKKRTLPVFYPLEMPLQYKMDSQILGRGRTVELNGEIVRFECDRTLPLQRNIQLVVRWPAVLPNGTPLNLWIVGTTTGVLCRDVEVEVLRYEFKTRSTPPANRPTVTNERIVHS